MVLEWILKNRERSCEGVDFVFGRSRFRSLTRVERESLSTVCVPRRQKLWSLQLLCRRLHQIQFRLLGTR